MRSGKVKRPQLAYSMRKRAGPGALLTLLATAGLAALPGLADNDHTTVLSIGDGDTLRLRSSAGVVTVRLACIDAPESSQGPWGPTARRELQALLPIGTAVELRTKATDRYGRNVAEVFSGARNINQALVGSGAAFVYWQYISGCDRNTYSRLDAQERTLCTLEGGDSGGVRTTDGGTGLQVTEITTDLDWKNANKATIPWSKVVKIRSALDGTYELAVFDRDYSSDFSTGAKEGVATKWTVDTLKGVVFAAGGCGFWTCTYGRGTVADLPDVVELHTSGKSYRLYGSSGEFAIPQAFIDDLLAAGTGASLNLKLIRGSTGGSDGSGVYE